MRMVNSNFFVMLLLIGCVVHSAPVRAVECVALVIGNGAYQKVPALPNPPRDGTDIGRALERLNFKVIHLTDGNAAEMRKAIVDFGRAAEGSEMAVVFYAGHGMEAGGENWLIPFDAELRTDADVESEAVSLRSISLQVSKARQLGLVILDACRNNPFPAKMQRSLRTRAVTRGLAPTEPTDNVLVAYAARDGTTASDGDGRNSPFTAALLRNIETPGLEISFLFRNVRDEVMTATKREQQPFVYGSLSKEAIYLKPLAVNIAPKASPVPSLIAPTSPTKEDEQFWQAIKTSDVAGLFEEFLKRYPYSSRAIEARERLAELKSKQVAPVSQVGASPSITVAKSEPPDSRETQSANDVSRQPRNLYKPEDAQRVTQMADELALKLPIPPFQIGETRSVVPVPYQRFVGIWSSKLGWDHGKGRHGMLVVTEVQSDGLARGYYLWGPATKLSWEKTPAGYTLFSERISDDTLSFKTGTTTIDVKLNSHNAMALHSTYLRAGKKAQTSSTEFSPIWQLVSPDQDRLETRRNDRSPETSRTAHRTERSSGSIIKNQCFSANGRQYCP